MKIGVVGYGTVGKAVADGFKKKGIEVYVNDIVLPFSSSKKQLMEHCDYIFVCVQTPTNKYGTIGLAHVFTAIEGLNYYSDKNNPIIIIKSTIVPGTTEYLINKYPNLRIVVNPEFLRQDYALQDFLDPDRIVIGTSDPFLVPKLEKLYGSFDCPVYITLPTVAELVKYLSNAYLVSKVAFACEAQKICDRFNVDAKKVMSLVYVDRRINRSHLKPSLGPIPKNSPCLPKDLQSLISHLESKGYVSKFLKAIYKGGVEP